MEPNHLTVPECRVNIRKYVLIRNTSHWKERAKRTVVWSPMTSIPVTATCVPVQAISGKQANGICFIPASDIEDDSKYVYTRLRISKEITSTTAHGIALVDSSPIEEFAYKKNDVFWISIGADVKYHPGHVTVLNLRSFHTGIVPLKAVCWYPKLQGPDGELMTPGGPTRENFLRISSSIYYSWVVRQFPNSTKIDTQEGIQLPGITGEGLFSDDESREQEEQGRPSNQILLLSSDERRYRFEELYRFRAGIIASQKSHSHSQAEEDEEDEDQTDEDILNVDEQHADNSEASELGSDAEEDEMDQDEEVEEVDTPIQSLIHSYELPTRAEFQTLEDVEEDKEDEEVEEVDTLIQSLFYGYELPTSAEFQALEDVEEDKEDKEDEEDEEVEEVDTPIQSLFHGYELPTRAEFQALEALTTESLKIAKKLSKTLDPSRAFLFPELIRPRSPEATPSCSKRRRTSKDASIEGSIASNESGQDEAPPSIICSSPSASDSLIEPVQFVSPRALERPSTPAHYLAQEEDISRTLTNLAFLMNNHRHQNHHARKRGEEPTGAMFSAANPMLMSNPTLLMGGRRYEEQIWNSYS